MGMSFQPAMLVYHFRVPITHQWIISAEVSERVFRAVDAAQQAAEELLLETETWRAEEFLDLEMGPEKLLVICCI